MDAISRDDAVARFAAFLDQEISTGQQGNRMVKLCIGRGGVICSIQGLARPEPYAWLPAVTAGSGEGKKVLTPEPAGR